MGKHLVLAGAGHAHMVTLKKLGEFIKRGHQVTVIGPDQHHYYSGMGPGMLGGTYTPEQISFASKRDVEAKGGTFIEAQVDRIDPVGRTVYLHNGDSVNFDLLSCNLGSHVPGFLVHDDSVPVYTVKPIENLLRARQQVLDGLLGGKQMRVAIAGGGPSAVELAGNLKQIAEEIDTDQLQVTLYARSPLMDRFSHKVRTSCMDNLRGRGVEVREGSAVKEVRDKRIVMENGKEYDVDLLLLAAGVQPSAVFRHSDLEVGPDGGLAVNEYLQSVQYPNIFGGGDCIYFQPQPLAKVGVYAVRQNPVLFDNLLASLEGGTLTVFQPQKEFLLIFNLGSGYGILERGWLFLKGSLAFRIKDFIDRRFISEFQ